MSEKTKAGPSGFTNFADIEKLSPKEKIDIYDRMMTDAQVRQAINDKRFAVISSDWEVLAASPGARDTEIAAFVKRSLDQMRGSVVQAAFGIMNALVHGYSISEMVFKPVETGADAGRWRIEALKPKHPRDYDFDIDPLGNITAIWITDGNGHRSKLPLWKFIIHTSRPEFGRPCGRSDLHAVYKHWWSKDFLLKWWNIYLETYGAPTRFGKYPAGDTAESKQEDLKRVLRDIVNNTAIAIHDDMDVDLVTSAGAAGFEAAIEYHDHQIVMGIVGGGEGYVVSLRRNIEDVVSGDIIKRMVDFNFASVDDYPRFRFKPKKSTASYRA